MKSEKTKVCVCGHTIMLSEEILHRISLLTECQYMKEEVDNIITKVIEMYQLSEDYNGAMTAESCMQTLSLLIDIKKDYAFFTTLEVERESVLAESPTEN